MKGQISEIVYSEYVTNLTMYIVYKKVHKIFVITIASTRIK